MTTTDKADIRQEPQATPAVSLDAEATPRAVDPRLDPRARAIMELRYRCNPDHISVEVWEAIVENLAAADAADPVRLGLPALRRQIEELKTELTMTFEHQAAEVYGDGFCYDGGQVDNVLIDQWAYVAIRCEHGRWGAETQGPIDLGYGLRDAMVKAKTAHDAAGIGRCPEISDDDRQCYWAVGHSGVHYAQPAEGQAEQKSCPECKEHPYTQNGHLHWGDRYTPAMHIDGTPAPERSEPCKSLRPGTYGSTAIPQCWQQKGHEGAHRGNFPVTWLDEHLADPS